MVCGLVCVGQKGTAGVGYSLSLSFLQSNRDGQSYGIHLHWMNSLTGPHLLFKLIILWGNGHFSTQSLVTVLHVTLDVL